MIAMILICSITLLLCAQYVQVQGFVTPCRNLKQRSEQLRLPSASTTTLWKTKSITCQASNGTMVHVNVTSAKSLRRLLAINALACLRDTDTKDVVGINNFRRLTSGHVYSMIDEHSETTNRATAEQAKTFDYSSLQNVELIRPPPINESEPADFVCEPDWMSNIIATIRKELTKQYDEVLPMAFVRCTGGGKTRSLKEIANEINLGVNLPVLFISYSGHSPVRDEEKSNPLQALCRRIAFEASIDPGQCNDWKLAFDNFYNQSYTFDPWEIKKWLGDSSVVLFIDDADILMDEKTDHSHLAKYGEFLKFTFIMRQNRFLIISLRTISMVLPYAECMTQYVRLQLLPYVYSLTLAISKLDRHLETPRQIVRFGQLPGLFYNKSPSRD